MTAHMGIVLPLNLFQFFMILGFLNYGLNWGKIKEVQLPKYKKAVLAGWKFWPPILLMMYKFVPIPY
jgi:protein Mpv17